MNLLLGYTDNQAKNQALLYRGARPDLASFYDIMPTLLDDTGTHRLALRIGRADMTDAITPEDVAAFLSALGCRRITPALRRRLGHPVEGVLALIPKMRGPCLKRIGEAMGEQARWIAPTLSLAAEIPDRDLVVINRS